MMVQNAGKALRNQIYMFISDTQFLRTAILIANSTRTSLRRVMSHCPRDVPGAIDTAAGSVSQQDSRDSVLIEFLYASDAECFLGRTVSYSLPRADARG
jgi:hypothetical protein